MGDMGILETVRQSEYTGENRCLPCTILNIVIAIGISTLVSIIVAQIGPTIDSLIVGLTVFTVFLGVIWLRGYLIPGTPALTERYMPERLLVGFGKHETNTSTITDTGEIDVETTLIEAGVLTPCSEGTDLCLAAEFDQAWEANLQRIDVDSDVTHLFKYLGKDIADADIGHYNDAAVVRSDGRKIGHWPSQTALQLDIAAVEPLSERIAEWNVLPPTVRSQLLSGVRIFIKECPEGGEVEFQSETVKSCCASYEVTTIICADSGDRLLEIPDYNL